MKKMSGLLLGLLLLLAPSLVAQTTQTSNPITLNGVAMPTAPVITVSGPAISPTGKYYCGSPLTVTVTAGTGTTFVSGDTIQWNGAAIPTVFTSPTVLTGAVSVTLATCVANTVTVVHILPALTMNNLNALPNAAAGTPYNLNLATYLGVSGGVKPYTFQITNGSLPTGLSLSASGVVSGTPSGAATKSFTLAVMSNGLALLEKQFKVEVARLEVAGLVVSGR